MNAQDLKPYVDAVVNEFNVVSGAIREKGAKRFGRAFGAAAIAVVLAYFGVYMPPQQKSARLQAEIDKAKSMADFGAQFKDLRDQLNLAYTGMPQITDRDQWLTNSVRDSLNVPGVVTEDFKPIREQELNGMVYQVSSVALSLRFADFFDWLLRLESARPLMQLQSLELGKKKENPGVNSATCEIATVMPKKRFH
jgi:type II secretory pathway component PulM